jgi:hypothetical protein
MIEQLWLLRTMDELEGKVVVVSRAPTLLLLLSKTMVKTRR